MPGWLTWHDRFRSRKVGLTPAVEAALRELGIRHFDDDLLKMPIAELRKHFGFGTTNNIQIGPFFRNVIWQLYEHIQAGDLPEFHIKRGMIRGMWYHIKTPISRYKTQCSAFLRRGVVPTAHAASSISWLRRACRSVDAVSDAYWPRLACAVRRGVKSAHRLLRARPRQ